MLLRAYNGVGALLLTLRTVSMYYLLFYFMAGPSDLGASYFCEWALGMCTTVTELKAAVLNGTCLIPADGVTGLCCD